MLSTNQGGLGRQKFFWMEFACAREVKPAKMSGGESWLLLQWYKGKCITQLSIWMVIRLLVETVGQARLPCNGTGGWMDKL